MIRNEMSRGIPKTQASPTPRVLTRGETFCMSRRKGAAVRAQNTREKEQKMKIEENKQEKAFYKKKKDMHT